MRGGLETFTSNNKWRNWLAILALLAGLVHAWQHEAHAEEIEHHESGHADCLAAHLPFALSADEISLWAAFWTPVSVAAVDDLCHAQKSHAHHFSRGPPLT